MFALPIAFFAHPAHAEVTVTVEPEAGSIDDTYTLTVTVSGQSASDLHTPQFSDQDLFFQIARVGTTQQTEIVNGRASFSQSFNYQLTPIAGLPPGTYPAPSGRIEVGGITVVLDRPSIRMWAGDGGNGGGNGGGGQTMNGLSAVRISQSVEPRELYVGQQAVYTTRIVTTPDFQEGNLEEAKLKGVWREKLDNFEKQDMASGDQRITVVSEVVIPTESGALEIPARELTATVRSSRGSIPNAYRRRGFFGPLFDDPGSFSRKRYTAAAFPFTVKPLPEAPPNKQNYIPVGKLKMRATIDPREITQGESVTLTVVVSGTGNLRPLELPEAKQTIGDFKRYDDKPELLREAQKGRILFTKIFKLAIVPKDAGSFMAPVFSILYFDPELNSFQTLQNEPLLIKVNPGTGENAFVVSGGQQAALSATGAQSNKADVALLGSDLLPQHVGPQSLTPAPTVSSAMLTAWLLLMPVLALALRIMIQRRMLFAADPARQVQRQALDKALKTLTGDEQATADHLFKTITTFLGERLRTTGSSLTAVEAKELVLARTKSDALAQETAEILKSLQALIYSNASSSAPDLAPLRDRAKQLLQKLDPAVRA